MKMLTNIKRENNNGRSMVEMLGVLAVIGVLSVGGMSAYGIGMKKYKISSLKDTVLHTLKIYGNLSYTGLDYYRIEGADAQEEIKEYNFISPCQLDSSAIPGASGYKVCRLPLGEQYIKIVPMEGRENMYSYMYFVTLTPSNAEVCSALLTAGWEELLPNDWWTRGKMWITSQNGSETLYGQTYTIPRSMAYKSKVCAKICKDSLKYCTIIFDFVGYN